jgi:hypothetical protein
MGGGGNTSEGGKTYVNSEMIEKRKEELFFRYLLTDHELVII